MSKNISAEEGVYKVLHIGNIANNAYLNAKLLLRYGVKSDVVCADYYHIMGTPEWEDADFDFHGIDHFNPDWDDLDLKGFQRPSWFYSGPLGQILAELAGYAAPPAKKQGRLSRIIGTAHSHAFGGTLELLLTDAWTKVFGPTRKSLVGLLTMVSVPILHVMCRVHFYIASLLKKDFDGGFERMRDTLNEINRRKKSDLRWSESVPYFFHQKLWERVFKKYDAVIGYSIDGIYPLLCKKKYIAFEHGTIRKIPFVDDALGRICKAVYKAADKVIITNCDNIKAAKKLQLKDYRFIPHPINEEIHKVELPPDCTERLHGQDFIVFHPARHHWDRYRDPSWEKGNDKIIAGFAKFRKATKIKAILVLTEWGLKIEQSRRLIKKLGIEEDVVWIPVLPNQHMIEMIRLSHVVIDQIGIGAFGSLAAKSLMCGKATLCHIDPEPHGMCFDVIPPLISVESHRDVADRLEQLSTDDFYRKNVENDSREWYLQHHSNKLIAERLIRLIKEVAA